MIDYNIGDVLVVKQDVGAGLNWVDCTDMQLGDYWIILGIISHAIYRYELIDMRGKKQGVWSADDLDYYFTPLVVPE